MSVETKGRTEEGEPLSRLFEPGQRLGWVYRDLEGYRHPFTESAPRPGTVPPELVHESQVVGAQFAERKKGARKAGFIIVGVFVLISFVITMEALVFAAVAAVFFGFRYLRAASVVGRASGAVDQYQAEMEERFDRARQAWEERRAAFDRGETERLTALDEWGTLSSAGTRRIDVFGGSQQSRAGLITVLGTSTLPERPVIVLDLTQAEICRDLSELTSRTAAAVNVETLPSRQEHSSVIDGMTSAELVDVLVEAAYGDSSDSSRAGRSTDTRILRRLCEALGEEVTPARIGAGLRVLLDESHDVKCLSREERRHIAGELLTDKNRDQVRDSLIRLEAYVEPLESLGSAYTTRAPGYLTCLSLDRTTGSASTELLSDLAILSVTRRLTVRAETPPTVVVALGEQSPQRRYLEQLASVCESRGAQLVLLHSHLRESARDMIGGGTVCFLKLGNHQEAAVAADFVGREHRFKLHALTDTHGASVQESVAETHGVSISLAETVGISSTTGMSWSGSFDYSQGGSWGGNRSRTVNRSDTRTESVNESRTGTHGTGASRTAGSTVQRVYEYTLEPTQLQALREFGLIMVNRAPDGRTTAVAAVCDPMVVTRERLSMEPLPDLPLPLNPPAAPEFSSGPPPQGHAPGGHGVPVYPAGVPGQPPYVQPGTPYVQPGQPYVQPGPWAPQPPQQAGAPQPWAPQPPPRY